MCMGIRECALAIRTCEYVYCLCMYIIYAAYNVAGNTCMYACAYAHVCVRVCMYIIMYVCMRACIPYLFRLMI